MKQEFIPYEQALALKELGFDEPCCQAYHTNGENELSAFYSNPNIVDEWLKKLPLIKAPLYQQAFRWFREKYGLFGYVFDRERGNYYWGISKLFSGETEEDSSEGPFDDSYEEAELACLDKLIEIVKNKK
jgi:hypothetical protein